MEYELSRKMFERIEWSGGIEGFISDNPITSLFILGVFLVGGGYLSEKYENYKRKNDMNGNFFKYIRHSLETIVKKDKPL